MTGDYIKRQLIQSILDNDNLAIKNYPNQQQSFRCQITNDPTTVANCWADYYEKLFSQLQDESFDEDFYKEVNIAVMNLLSNQKHLQILMIFLRLQ